MWLLWVNSNPWSPRESEWSFVLTLDILVALTFKIALSMDEYIFYDNHISILNELFSMIPWILIAGFTTCVPSIRCAQVFRESKVPSIDLSPFEAKQVFFPSKDGTRIPMFIVGPKVTDRISLERFLLPCVQMDSLLSGRLHLLLCATDRLTTT